MASVQEFVAIDSAPDGVFALIRDQRQRGRLLPDGWRFLRSLGEKHDGAGASMEIEARIGPGTVRQVIQTQEITEDNAGGRARLVESPPTADNYITTWTVAASGEQTLVGLHTEFSYGGLIGEFFVKRQLRKAYREMLGRLKALAEAGPGRVTSTP